MHVQAVTDELELGELEFAGHVVHAEPTVSLYVPVLQAVHALAAASEYAPAEQVIHALAPVGEYDPA